MPESSAEKTAVGKDALSVAVTGGIAVVTLDRPDKLNALTPPMMTALGSALDEIHANRDIQVVVITGPASGPSAPASTSTVLRCRRAPTRSSTPPGPTSKR